jgi:DNA-binding NtrC family response regulator
LPYNKTVPKLVSKAIKELRENRTMKNRIEALKKGYPEELIGTSELMEVLYSQMRQVAPTRATVMIYGESGTGKDLLARAIHELSPRRKNKYVPVDCGALPETLLESELFGHKKGAYTGAHTDEAGLFQEADGGTIFLDEIASASLGVQSKLLHFLQAGEIRRIGENQPRKVDARVICATNRDLEDDVKEKRFRSDLYYRLKVITLKIPPLRERGGDILLLAEHFRKAYSAKYDKPVRKFTRGAIKAILKSPWTGNVRELQHAVERAVVLCQGHYLDLADLEIPTPPAKGKSRYREAIEAKRRELVETALGESHGNITGAAASLSMDRTQLRRLMMRYGLQGSRSKGRPKEMA